MPYIRILFIVFVVMFTLGLAGIAAATGEDEIVVNFEDATSQFPNGVTFEISVESSSPIEEIRVFYKSELTSTTSYGHVELEPGNSVEGSFFLDTGGGVGGFIPAGAKIVYSFEVRDQAGNVLRTKEKEFVYLDSRFEWVTMSEGPLTVYHYGPTEKRAETVLRSAQEAVIKMSRVLGVAEIEPINIIAYNNYRHMVVALPPRSQAVREDLVTQGQAFTEIRVLLVLAFDEDIAGITSHEVTHILIDDAAGRGYAVLPIWLNEGLAEFGNIAPSESYDDALLYGIYTRRVKPLWHLQSFSGGPDDVIIGYGQSRSVVAYLVNSYGEEKMSQFMRTLDATLSVDRALTQVYGFDQRGLDTEWRNWIGLRPLEEGELDAEGPPEAASEAEAVPEPAPTASPTPALGSTPAPVHTAMPSEDEGEDVRTSPGCNRASGSSAAIPSDAFFFVLLAGPLRFMPLRRLIRRR